MCMCTAFDSEARIEQTKRRLDTAYFPQVRKAIGFLLKFVVSADDGPIPDDWSAIATAYEAMFALLKLVRAVISCECVNTPTCMVNLANEFGIDAPTKIDSRAATGQRTANQIHDEFVTLSKISTDELIGELKLISKTDAFIVHVKSIGPDMPCDTEAECSDLVCELADSIQAIVGAYVEEQRTYEARVRQCFVAEVLTGKLLAGSALAEAIRDERIRVECDCDVCLYDKCSGAKCLYDKCIRDGRVCDGRTDIPMIL